MNNLFNTKNIQTKNIDITLILLILTYSIFGLILLLSASEQNTRMVAKQVFHLTLGTIIIFQIRKLSSNQLQQLAIYLYIIAIIMLICVLLFGYTGKGAKRWLDLKFIKFEPSEIMKIALPLILASYIHHTEPPLTTKTLFISSLLIILPFILIAKQPDLGTATIIASIGIFTLLIAGLPIKYIGRMVFTLVLSSPFSWHMLHEYQKKRILTLLMPSHDSAGSGYHIQQAKIAIGAGGIFGKGWMKGTQSHLKFLPEHNTDFIFALCAEEFGFIGCLLLILFILIIIGRCLHISMHAKDHFTRFASAGITFAFGICSFINIAMVTAIIPVVGIPLPLISYGGTTMVVSLIGFSIISSCKEDKKLFST